ncbi:MAG: sugar ABC transporter permease [Methylobacteriaceae bacterium]|nr:sugar ABC transporter permease [Methylobacteriaceae bacterium]
MKHSRPPLPASSGSSLASLAVAPPGAPRPRPRRLWLVQLTFVLPALAYLAALCLFPLYYNVRMSLEHVTVGSFLTGVAPFVGLQNYRDLLGDALFFRALEQMALFTVLSIVGQMGIGMSLALLFWRSFPLSTAMRALLLVPWLLPLIVSATVFQWIFDFDSGVLNYALRGLHLIGEPVPWLTSSGYALAAVVITNIWVGVPFSMAVFYSGLQSLPKELYEAAELDGANALQRFWFVTLPLLRPLTAIVFSLSVIYTVKVFDLIFVLTHGGPADSTQTLATYSYQLSFRNLDFGHGAAVGNVLVLVSLCFAVLYLRSFRRTMAAGEG